MLNYLHWKYNSGRTLNEAQGQKLVFRTCALFTSYTVHIIGVCRYVWTILGVFYVFTILGIYDKYWKSFSSVSSLFNVNGLWKLCFVIERIWISKPGPDSFSEKTNVEYKMSSWKREHVPSLNTMSLFPVWMNQTEYNLQFGYYM